MQYRILDSEALADLRLERLRTLEIEHARNALRLEDAVDPGERQAIINQLDDLDRRHALHLEFAAPTTEQDEPDDEPGPDDPEPGPDEGDSAC